MTVHSVSDLSLPFGVLDTCAMSCLALTLTCESRPVWLQIVLQKDVKPAQYETEIARLNAQVALPQRQRDEQRQQLELLQVQQRLVVGIRPGRSMV